MQMRSIQGQTTQQMTTQQMIVKAMDEKKVISRFGREND